MISAKFVALPKMKIFSFSVQSDEHVKHSEPLSKKFLRCFKINHPKRMSSHVDLSRHDWLFRFTAKTREKECGSDRSSRLWGGVLRDDPKNGCVVDYVHQ